MLPPFTTEQQELILGTLLGDGCLLLNSSANAHLQCAHGVKQRAYLEFKHRLLAPFSRPINVCRRYDPRYGRTYETHRFHTVCHPWLTQLRRLLYPAGAKVLPDAALNMLTPQALAFWFMDDGGCIRESTLSICTVSFDPASVGKAAALLGTRWGLNAWENRRRLFISAASKARFAELTAAFIPDFMRYKLGNL